MIEPMFVKLHGGPADGQTVELIGIRYDKGCISRRGKFFAARYLWTQNHGVITGRFSGYFRSNRKVRRDGSRMPRRKKC